MNFLSHIVTSMLVRLGYMYFRIRSLWSIWFYVVNRKNRRAFKKNKSTLSVVQKRIVSDLMRDGIAVAHIDDFFPASDLLSRFQVYTNERINHAETKTHKSFLKNLWDAVPLIEQSNPFIPFALGDEILTTVNEYMQMFSYFFYLTLNVTMPVSIGSEAVQSQRWHGDPEDRKMCKVFMYVNDVDEGSGPFTYVKGTQDGGRWRHLFRQHPPRGFLPLNRPIEELVPASDIMRFMGKAGTIIFCDTSGYHRGGYATKQKRIMLTIGYCSSACAYPLRIRFDEAFFAVAEKQYASPAARYALTFMRGRMTQYFFKKIKPNFKYGAE